MSDRTWIQQSPGKEGINRNALSEQTVPSAGQLGRMLWTWVLTGSMMGKYTRTEHRKHTVLTHRKHSSSTTKQPAAANYSKLWRSSCSRNSTGSAVGEARTTTDSSSRGTPTHCSTNNQTLVLSWRSRTFTCTVNTRIQISRGDSPISWLHQ